MKKIIITLICLLPLTGMVSGNNTSALSPLLSLYYDIKNALVNSDGTTASAKASEYVKTVNGIDVTKLSASEQKAFKSLKEKLLFDAEHIAETKDVAHQRDHFSSFSDNMYKLVKATDLSANPVYQMYCPMKKVYWLSNEKEIKNPYYGQQMLNCGKITDTRRP